MMRLERDQEGHMIRNRTVAIAFGVIAIAASPAFAQGPGPQGMGPGAGGGGGMAVVSAICAKEIATYCTAAPRGPAAWVCLNEHQKDLSENCLQVVEGTGPDMGPGMGPVARLCMTEIAQNCAGIEHGSGLVRECLEKDRSKLSESCNVALDNTGWGRRRWAR
jgi:hypothetical protein